MYNKIMHIRKAQRFVSRGEALLWKRRGSSPYLLGVKGFGISKGVQPQKVHSGSFCNTC